MSRIKNTWHAVVGLGPGCSPATPGCSRSLLRSGQCGLLSQVTWSVTASYQELAGRGGLLLQPRLAAQLAVQAGAGGAEQHHCGGAGAAGGVGTVCAVRGAGQD